MNLENIVDEIFDIAQAIECNTIPHLHTLLVSVKHQNRPDELLLAVAAPLKRKMANHMSISKTELEKSLNALQEIGKKYKIKELIKTTKDLQAYLDTLA